MYICRREKTVGAQASQLDSSLYMNAESERNDGFGKRHGIDISDATSARRPTPGVSTFCQVGQASLPVISWGLQASAPCPTTRFGERKKSYTPLFQTLTPIRPCQATQKIRPLLLQCKQKVVREKHLGGGAKISAIPPRRAGNNEGGRRSGESGDIRRGARLQTCRAAIRGDTSLQHVFAAWSKASAPPQPPNPR